MTEEGEEPAPTERLHAIRMRSIHRDRDFLRLPRKNAMRGLAEDFNEWIVQETRDLLETLDVLKRLEVQGINAELQPYERRVKDIQKNHVRRVILPMRKIGRGTSGGKNEEEHCRKFQTALSTVFGTMQELIKIRENLTMITVTIECVTTANNNQNQPQPDYVA